MAIAFLIIDVQNGYVGLPGFKDMIHRASMYINEVSEYFRKANQPVIHIQHKDPSFRKDSSDMDVAPDITQKESDLHLEKTYGNAFWETHLDRILKDLEVDFVICAGLSATHCVLATYNGALERGYKAVMLQNGLLGETVDEVKTVQSERNLISYTAVGYLLKHLK